MGFFNFQYVFTKPNQVEVAEGVFIPRCGDCSGEVLLQAVGVIGAVIMPHNLYLHSGLVKVSYVHFYFGCRIHSLYELPVKSCAALWFKNNLKWKKQIFVLVGCWLPFVADCKH